MPHPSCVCNVSHIKPHHIDYIIPKYNIENELRIKRRGGGVCLYIHNSLQYKVRNDLKIGNDQEAINSVFIEIDKNSTNTKRNLIVGCIYRPPWVNIKDTRLHHSVEGQT